MLYSIFIHFVHHVSLHINIVLWLLSQCSNDGAMWSNLHFLIKNNRHCLSYFSLSLSLSLSLSISLSPSHPATLQTRAWPCVSLHRKLAAITKSTCFDNFRLVVVTAYYHNMPPPCQRLCTNTSGQLSVYTDAVHRLMSTCALVIACRRYCGGSNRFDSSSTSK